MKHYADKQLRADEMTHFIGGKKTHEPTQRTTIVGTQFDTIHDTVTVTD